MSILLTTSVPGTSSICPVVDNNANLTPVAVSVPSNGTFRLTTFNGTNLDNSGPYFANLVLTGLSLTLPTAGNFLSLSYTAGSYQLNAQVFTIGSGGTIAISAGDPSNPRIDTIWANNAGALVYTIGTPGVDPVPVYTNDQTHLIIAYVYVQTGATSGGGTLLYPFGAVQSLPAGSINGQVLTWNNTTHFWYPGPSASLPTGTTTGSMLYWNGSAWVEETQLKINAAGVPDINYNYTSGLNSNVFTTNLASKYMVMTSTNGGSLTSLYLDSSLSQLSGLYQFKSGFNNGIFINPITGSGSPQLYISYQDATYHAGIDLDPLNHTSRTRFFETNGTNLTEMVLNSGSNTITIQNQGAASLFLSTDLQINGGQRYTTTNVNAAASPYTVLVNDYIIEANSTLGAVTLVLPSSPTVGKTYHIIDTFGFAGTHNITVNGNGFNINGFATLVMTISRQAVTLVFSGSFWNLVSSTSPIDGLPGTTLGSVLRWNGSNWVESTDILLRPSANKDQFVLTNGSRVAGLTLDENGTNMPVVLSHTDGTNLAGLDLDPLSLGSGTNLYDQNGTNKTQLYLNSASQISILQAGDLSLANYASFTARFISSTWEAIIASTANSQSITVGNTISLNGGLSVGFQNQSTGFTAAVGNYTYLITTSAPVAVTLPSPTGLAGQKWIFKDKTGLAHTNNITITPTSGTIAGGSNYIINNNYGFVELITDGTNWYVVSGSITQGGVISNVTIPGAYPYTTLKNDYIIAVQSSGARGITLLASPETGRRYIIKDSSSNSNAGHITITPAAGNIDGNATLVLSSNGASVELFYNGTQWNII